MVADPKRIAEFMATQEKEARWAADIDFLDTIDTLEEFNDLLPTIASFYASDFLEFYRENLIRWPKPELPEGFKEKCPLLTARLNTPWKVRILLRGAHFRDVEPLLMGEVLEEILHKHEVEGQQIVAYKNDRCGAWGSALRTIYHTQVQARTLTRLAFPDCTRTGTSSNIGTFVDWRTKEQRNAVGEN